MKCSHWVDAGRDEAGTYVLLAGRNGTDMQVYLPDPQPGIPILEELQCTVEFDHQPEERPVFDPESLGCGPGCAESIEITGIQVVGGFDLLTVIRNYDQTDMRPDFEARFDEAVWEYVREERREAAEL